VNLLGDTVEVLLFEEIFFEMHVELIEKKKQLAGLERQRQRSQANK